MSKAIWVIVYNAAGVSFLGWTNISNSMEDCVFCKIVNATIPSTKVYEDTKVLAFLDVAPGNKGHTLVVPKGHFERLTDIPPDILSHIAGILQKLAQPVTDSVGASAYNIEQANGGDAGQVVPHAHFHIIPRFSGDEVRMAWKPLEYGEGEAAQIAEKIKAKVSPPTEPSPEKDPEAADSGKEEPAPEEAAPEEAAPKEATLEEAEPAPAVSEESEPSPGPSAQSP